MSCSELRCVSVVKVFEGAYRVNVKSDAECENCGSSYVNVEYKPVSLECNVGLEFRQ